MSSNQARLGVTVLITTRDRPEELGVTLRGLRRQNYRPLELVVIDDHSAGELEQEVRREWPEATVIRNEANLGLIASRSLGMKLASGDYILSLDDDSCLTDTQDISRAVSRMATAPDVGVLTFSVHNGRNLDASAHTQDAERYVHTFIGCGHMIRKSVVSQIGGYRDFYHYYGEEHEYTLRVLDAGWRILFFPAVVVHHRVSDIGRRRGRIWAYSLRNNIWTIILHMPATRLPVEVLWKIAMGTLEAVRLFQVRWYLWALFSMMAGLPQVLRLRRPISPKTVLLYDSLRCGQKIGIGDSKELEPVTWQQRWHWFVSNWRHRRRARPFWDRRPGGLGRSSVATFSGDNRSR